MTSTILTSDRYIAIRFATGTLSSNGVVRILTKDGLIHPARWHAKNCRLESCAINSASIVLPMYEKTQKLEAKVKAALAPHGMKYAWLTADEAKALAS